MAHGDLARAAALAGAGRIDVESVISERFPLSAGAEAFEALRTQRGLKVLIEPWTPAAEGGSQDG
jgi:L-iditol 2-dehydrogenase